MDSNEIHSVHLPKSVRSICARGDQVGIITQGREALLWNIGSSIISLQHPPTDTAPNESHLAFRHILLPENRQGYIMVDETWYDRRIHIDVHTHTNETSSTHHTIEVHHSLYNYLTAPFLADDRIIWKILPLESTPGAFSETFRYACPPVSEKDASPNLNLLTFSLHEGAFEYQHYHLRFANNVKFFNDEESWLVWSDMLVFPALGNGLDANSPTGELEEGQLLVVAVDECAISRQAPLLASRENHDDSTKKIIDHIPCSAWSWRSSRQLADRSRHLRSKEPKECLQILNAMMCGDDEFIVFFSKTHGMVVWCFHE